MVADQNEIETQMNYLQGPEGGADKDPKKLRRMVAKRDSAKRTCLRKNQYTLELEGEVKTLEIEAAIAPTRIKYFDRHNASQKRQCSMIEQKISLYTNQLESKRAKYESLMGQREILTRLCMVQRQRGVKQSSVAATANQAGQLVGPSPDQLMGPTQT